jgi:PKD domain/Secretion system C-terminal sorting domain
MKNFYALLAVTLITCISYSQSTQCVTIRGDRTSGKFKQLLLDSKIPNHGDTAQPELPAAAWTCNADGFPTCNFRSLFRFDVASIPSNAVITSAKLYLFAKTTNILGNVGSPTYGTNNVALLQRVTNYWNLGTTGWSNQPTVTTTGQKTLPQSTGTAQNYVVDIKDIVQYWTNNPDSNYGASLRLQVENYYNSLIFHSGQGPDSLKPKLEICYQVPVTPPCNNSLVIKGDRITGLFKQLHISNLHTSSSDTSQPEIVAAAWTCNADGSPTCDFRAIFKYNVSSIPANAVITSAKLYLYAKTNNLNGNPGSPTFGANNTALLQKVITPWQVAANIGWTNQPSATTANQKILAQSTNTAQNYVVEMTDFVQYWVNKPDSNYGVLLKLQAEQYYNSMVFNSGQAPDSLKPRLEICYTLTSPDSCKADFRDSTQNTNSLYRQFTGLPWHNNIKKPVQICWNFGDGKDTCINYNPGNIFSSYQVAHTYLTAGQYNVCIKIKYDGGCIAEKCRTIQVIGPPPPPACNNSLIIRGNRTNGKFKQLFLDNRGANSADTTQPELGAAAWTCNAQGSPTCNFRSVFRYDVSAIPANAVITGARLYLYAKTNNINGYPGNPTYGPNNATLLQRVVKSWTVAGTGWANQPAATTVNQKVLPQSSGTAQNYVVDMMDFVQYWVSHPDSNYGALIRLQAEQYYNSMIFNSGQGADSLQPRLEICYTVTGTGPDSCKSNFTDSASTTHPLEKEFTAQPWNSGNKKPVQVCWNFGDGNDTCINYIPGNNSNSYAVTHIYKESGNYTVCVTIKYDGGCKSDKCRKVTVFGAPAPPSDCANTIVVKGDRVSGKYQQIFLDSKSPNASDTTQPELGAAAWTCNSQGFPICNFRSLFRYELGSIPANAKITGAKLYLYAKSNNINGIGGSPTFGNNNTTLLQQVTEPWTVTGTHWSNQPAVTTQHEKVLPQSTSPVQNYSIDVSDFVQYWIKHPEKNYGLLLRMQTEEYYNSMIFNSGQAPDSLKPRLEICYETNGPADPAVQIKLYPNPTTGPILVWVFTPDVTEGDVKLYDLQGNFKQVIKSSLQFYAGVNVIQLQINRSSVPSGTYFIKVRVGNTDKTFKILVL